MSHGFRSGILKQPNWVASGSGSQQGCNEVDVQGYDHLKLNWAWRTHSQGGSLTWPLAGDLSSSPRRPLHRNCSCGMAVGFPRASDQRAVVVEGASELRWEPQSFIT